MESSKDCVLKNHAYWTIKTFALKVCKVPELNLIDYYFVYHIYFFSVYIFTPKIECVVFESIYSAFLLLMS
jgi:hypothetical protein